MNRIDKTEHLDLIEQAVTLMKKKGFDNIKVDGLDEYERPKTMVQQSNGEEYTPDLIGFRNGQKFYIDIGLKNDNIRRTVSKWRLLETLAQRKNNGFYLLVPRGSFRFVNDIVDRHSISVKVIKLY